ncbi:MAG: TIGR02281 family clan AA aspartic protease [Pseudomonadota bacterium]
MTTKRVGAGMYVLALVALLGLLTVLFSDELDRQKNPNQQPHVRFSEGIPEVALKRNRGGHYVVSGTINDAEATFLVDTGATDVAVGEDLARRAGLYFGQPVTVSTANGRTQAYTTVISRVTIGPIEAHNVEGAIVPNLGSEVLLGMSFLRRLDFLQRADELILRPSSEAN